MSAFRIAYNLERGVRCTWILFVCGAFGVALFQHNGWYALLPTLICFVAVAKNGRWALVSVGVSVHFVSYFMMHQMLGYLAVEPIAARESLSIPIQQVARAVIDDGVGAAEVNQLNGFVEVDELEGLYSPHLSDPVKWSIDERYYSDHRDEFFSIYLRLALEHPKAYLKAWIDETKGYWFGGYAYSRL